MPITRIGERLSKVTDHLRDDRSRELPELTKKFHTFVKAFKPLSDSLNEHYEAMKKLESTQIEIIGQIAEWSKNSSLAEGDEDDKIATVQTKLLQREHEYSDAFMSDVIAYVHEWEIVITTRIEALLKQAKDLRQNLDHYEKKVGTLHKQHDSLFSRKKVPDDKISDKVIRNDEKLLIAENEYRFHVDNLCNLMDEAIECCWKDVHPLLFRLMTLEGDRLVDKTAILSESGVVDKLKAIAEANDIDLSKPPPSEASTSAGGGEEKDFATLQSVGAEDAEKENASTQGGEEPVANSDDGNNSYEPMKADETPSKLKEREEALSEV